MPNLKDFLMFSWRQRISEVPIMLGGFKLFSTALWAPSLAALSRVVNHHWIARSGAVSRRGNSFGVLWVLPRYFWLNQSGLVNEDSHLFDGKIRKIIQHNPAKLGKGETYIYIIIYIYPLVI